jgi:GR25 family glycosyltransferase involved in LPS biosynthesis
MTFFSGAPKRAWIINLDHRPDRFENVRRQAELNGIAIERHPACNPSKGDVVPVTDVAPQWDTTLNARFDHTYKPHAILNMSLGERGCAMSHLQLWRKMVAQSLPMAMIFEDDIILAPNFTRRLDQYIAALPADWDIFYLEYANGYPATKVVANPPMYKGVYVWHTGAYVMSLKGAMTCIQNLPIDGPVDNFLARLIHSRRLVAYLPTPPLAQQMGGDSDIEHTHTQNRAHFKDAQPLSRSPSIPSSLPVGFSLHHHTARSYEAATAGHVGPLVIHASYHSRASYPASMTSDSILDANPGGSGYYSGGSAGVTFSPGSTFPGSGGYFSVSSPRSPISYAEVPYNAYTPSTPPPVAYNGTSYSVATSAASPVPVVSPTHYGASELNPAAVFQEPFATTYGPMSDYTVTVSPAAAHMQGIVSPTTSPFEAPARTFSGTTPFAGPAPTSPLVTSPLSGHTALSFAHALAGASYHPGAGSVDRSRSPTSPYAPQFPATFIAGSTADFVRSPLSVPSVHL